MKTPTLSLIVLSALCLTVSASAQMVVPEWVHPGTRLVYQNASARVAEVGTQLVPSTGGWRLPSGQIVSPEDVQGTGAASYTVFDVGHVDTVSSSTLMTGMGIVDLERNLVTASPFFAGSIDRHWADTLYWHDPAGLAQLRDGTVNGVTIMHLQYPVGRQMHDAVRIIIPSNTGGSIATYDLDSGILLFASIIGENSGLVANGNTATMATVSTDLQIVRFMEYRDVKLPWRDMAAPEWVGRLHSVTFDVDLSAVIGGISSQHFLSQNKFAFTGFGTNWLSYTVHGTNDENRKGIRAVTASGNRKGLFIPPQILGQLHEGQVLDNDPALGLKLVVTAIDENGVTLTEYNSIYRNDMTYDTNGMLASYVFIQKGVDGATITRGLRSDVR